MALTLSQFVAKYNGHSWNYDGVYGYQCWDLAAFYARDVARCPSLPTGNGCASGVYTNFLSPLPKYFKRYANTATAVPKPGDMIVWSGSMPGSYGCGHIAICLSANMYGFTSLDQNWGGAYAHKVYHNYNYVMGWLRPITTAPATTSYTVRSGDTLSAIASRYGTTYQQLVVWNKARYPSLATNPNNISVGWTLRVR